MLHSNNVENNEHDLNFILEENQTLKKQVEALNQTIFELKTKIQETEECLENEIQNLRNSLIDKDFETGMFVEKEIFIKMDLENARLRKLLDEFYKKELQNWYCETKRQIKEN